MGNNKYHYKNYGTKNKRQAEKNRKNRELNPSNKIPFDEKVGLIPEHDLAQEYQVTIHAIRRYTERVLGLDPNIKLDKKETYMIAKAIRISLPEHLINEAKYNLFDDYYAVVNGGLIVTIVKANK